jgi:Flp pilus assembly protein TadG
MKKTKRTSQTDSQDKRAQWISRLSLRSALLDNRGSSVLELALVMPVFVMMFMMAVEGGRMAYFGIEVSNAARAGVAYAAQSTATSTSTSAIQTAASNDAPDLTSISALTVTPILACQCANGTSFTTISCGTASTTCVSPSRTIKYVQVSTSAQVSSMLRYPGLPTTYNLQGQATMRIE